MAVARFVDCLTFEQVRLFFEEHGITGKIIFFPNRRFDAKKKRFPKYREYIVKNPPKVRTFILSDSKIYEQGNENFEITNEDWQAFMYKCFGKRYKADIGK